MKLMSLFLLFFLLIGCTAHAGGRKKVPGNSAMSSQPLLVELFTSEGCSSCPPAEALLAKYEKEQPFQPIEVITLAFHVDYWDGLGWKDKYASPLFTQRQKVYDRKFRTGQIYTPQMVVDGHIEFVGSREKDAKKAIKKAARKQKASMSLSLEDNQVSVEITGLTNEESASIYFAIAEDGLGSRVDAGENAGKELTHVSVVRSLTGVARVLPNAGDHTGKYSVALDPEWNTENLKLVVFVQENFSRKIVAVSQVSIES